MHPAILGILTGLAVLIIGELLRLLIRSLQASVFNDAERKYIDDRIIHKLNNYRMEADARYAAKKHPGRLGE